MGFFITPVAPRVEAVAGTRWLGGSCPSPSHTVGVKAKQREGRVKSAG